MTKKRGVRLGRPPAINAHRDDIVRLRGQGLSGRAIGKVLGVPSSIVLQVFGDSGSERPSKVGWKNPTNFRTENRNRDRAGLSSARFGSAMESRIGEMKRMPLARE
jgi:hypothetical protein